MAVEDSIGFSKDEFTFLKEPPKQIEIECPICLQVMLNDPHLVSCCGHHFCGTCIKRVKDSNGACPYCKEKEYQTMPNKDRLRIINGLKVNCTNKGCEWKGELKKLSVHLNKGKREGQCQYEVVTCVHSGCEIKKQRQYLVKHEKNDCNQRIVFCSYCKLKGTCQFIVNEHFSTCTQYPVPCPNECGCLDEMPRCDIQTHVTEECPLQSVECEFKWAGCQYTSLRKDLQQHNNDSQLKHMSLLAKECKELKNENQQLKKENQVLRQELAEVPYQLKEMIHDTFDCGFHPILPVCIPSKVKDFQFYSDVCGYHMSVSVTRFIQEVIFTVYKRKFYQPKVTKVVVKADGITITLSTGSHKYNYYEHHKDIKGNVVQKFSFGFEFAFYNLEIISVF